MNHKHPYLIVLIAAALAGIVLLIAPFIGLRFIAPAQLTGDPLAQQIFWFMRVPRVLVAFLAGGTLALCGMVFQAMFRNPLAEPFTLGISSGASFGAALCMLLNISGSFLGLPLSSIGALCGALCAMAIVYGITMMQRTVSNYTMLLAGIAVSFTFSSLILFIQYLSDMTHSFQIIRWLMGGVEVYGYQSLFSMMPILLIGLMLIVFNLPVLDHLLSGDDLAQSRGVNVAQVKRLLLLATSLCAGSIVAVCGPIGFVGMMIPHVCRLAGTTRHTMLGPLSFLTGGIFLVAADTLARTIIAPAEIPVGIITALFGGPFFLWILLNRNKNSSHLF